MIKQTGSSTPTGIRSRGFSAVGAIIVVIVVTAIGIGGWYVWHKNQKSQPSETDKQTAQAAQAQSADTTTSTTKQPDPYSGWRTHCDPDLKACYRYPSDWVAYKYGGFQNSAGTAYFNYQNPSNKDQASESVFIADIEDPTSPNTSLKIVGYVVNNYPIYVLYNSSVVTEGRLAVGQTTKLVTTNPTFSGKSNQNVSFVATPGTNGIAAISDINQAKAWFDTPEAKEGLKILTSFYYQ